jgi:hypothetical protein
MNGLWVALATPVTTDSVRRTLSRWFPPVPSCTEAEALAMSAEWPPIVFSVTATSAPDFPVLVSFLAFPGDPTFAESVSCALGHRFSEEFGCRVLCEAPELNFDGSPYWVLLWDGAASFLAVDSNTALADGDGGEVRVVRPLAVQLVSLDETGRLSTVG